MDPNPAVEMARKRWAGTTKAERSNELRRVSLEGWKTRPRAKKKRKAKRAVPVALKRTAL